MTIYPFYLPHTINIVSMYGDCIHLHVQWFNPHAILTNLLIYDPYYPYSNKPPFYPILTRVLHVYNNSSPTKHRYTSLFWSTTKHNSTPSHKILPVYLHHQEYLDIPLYYIRPNNPALVAYTHDLTIVLPSEKYTRDTMSIIDHLYIGIPPRSSTKRSLTIFASLLTSTYPIPWLMYHSSSNQNT